MILWCGPFHITSCFSNADNYSLESPLFQIPISTSSAFVGAHLKGLLIQPPPHVACSSGVGGRGGWNGKSQCPKQLPFYSTGSVILSFSTKGTKTESNQRNIYYILLCSQSIQEELVKDAPAPLEENELSIILAYPEVGKMQGITSHVQCRMLDNY